MAEWTVGVPKYVADSLERSLNETSMSGEHDVAELRELGVHVEPGMRNLLEHLVKTNSTFPNRKLSNKNFKVEIFSEEHPPPHFRVIYAGDSNCFRIDDCTPMYKYGLKNHLELIREWHTAHKLVLIETWDRTRPADCPVGKFKA